MKSNKIQQQTIFFANQFRCIHIGGLPQQQMKGFWSDLNTQREFFDNLYIKLNFKNWTDWYNISNKVIMKHGGASILHYYKNSPVKALCTIYPSYPWRIWEFKQVPRSFWKNTKNQRKFFDWIASQLHVECWLDWYEVTIEEVAKLGGSGLLMSRYQGSLINALKSIYPEYPWADVSYFPHGYWKKPENQRNCLDQIAKKLNITEFSQWYIVRRADIAALGGASLLSYYKNSLIRALRTIYPEYPWESSRARKWLQASISKRQRSLFKAVQEIFPDEVDIHLDYWYPSLRKSSKPIILDIYVPSLKIGFEYQGEHHYEDVAFYMSSLPQQNLDAEKKEICSEAGLTLIVVPYWWDGTRDSLKATIQKVRPEVIADKDINAAPIPDSLPARIPRQNLIEKFS